MSRSFPKLIIRLQQQTHSEPRFLTAGIPISAHGLQNFDVCFHLGSYYFLENGHKEYKSLKNWGDGQWVAFPMIYSIRPDESGAGLLIYGDGDHWTRQPVSNDKVTRFQEAVRLVAKHYQTYTPHTAEQQAKRLIRGC